MLTMVLNFREAGEIFEYKFIFYFPDFQEIPCKNNFFAFFYGFLLFTPTSTLKLMVWSKVDNLLSFLLLGIGFIVWFEPLPL